MRHSAIRRTNGRHRVSRRRREPFAWLGAGAITLGVGAAALAGGSGIAHADGTAPKSPSPSGSASSHTSSVGDKPVSATRSSNTGLGGTLKPRPHPARPTAGPGSDLPHSSSAPEAATTRISATVRAMPVTRAVAAATPAAAANPVVGLLAGVLSVFGLNAPAAPANPLRAVVWRSVRTIETGLGLTPLAGTPIVGTPDPRTGVVIGTLGFTEPAGQPLTYSVTTNPTQGSVTVDSTGNFVYTPAQAGIAGTDMFTVTASDRVAATSETVNVPLGSTDTDTVISAQYGSTTIQGRYVVQNNAYNNGGGQTINVTSTGFSIIVENGSASTSGAPLAYPSIYIGCHYGNCSPSSPLPVQLSQIHSVTSSITYTYVATGIYDASYDIWLDPAPKTTGVNQQEIMIWFKEQGPIQPVGSQVATTTIAGQSWQVWQGSNGQNNVVSYVASTPTATLTNFSVLSFIVDTESRTAQSNAPVTNGWYLTSIQAGFEPWNGGVGLTVDSFSATIG